MTPARSLSVVVTQPRFRSGDCATDVARLFDDGPSPPSCDVLVLPELIGGDSHVDEYLAVLRSLAQRFACTVVGGSCYAHRGDARLNTGYVVADDGRVLCQYDKRRPYGVENDAGVGEGSAIGQFEIGGRRVAVLICSDLWFSRSIFAIDGEPDMLLIPSFSITQRGRPNKARALWQHMAVARAYEFSTYVGVCDWSEDCAFEGFYAAGASGFADPRPHTDEFFSANGDALWRGYTLDFDRLEALRVSRERRGFSSAYS